MALTGLTFIVGNGAWAQTHLPAPTDLTGVASCIRANSGVKPDDVTKYKTINDVHRAAEAAPETTVNEANLAYDMIRFMNSGVGGQDRPECIPVMVRDPSDPTKTVDITDVSTRIAAARTKIIALGTDTTATDYASKLAALREEFGGPVVDAVYDEYRSFLDINAAESRYDSVFQPLPTAADPTTFTTLASSYRDILILDDSVGGGTNYQEVTISALIAQSVAFPEIVKEDGDPTGRYTGVIPSRPAASTGTATFSTLGALRDAIRTIEGRVDDYTKMLAADDGELLASERAWFNDYIAAGQQTLRQYTQLRQQVEGGTAAGGSGTAAENAAAARQTVSAYNARRTALQAIATDIDNRIDTFEEARDALKAAIVDPGRHIDQLVTSAAYDHKMSVDNNALSSTVEENLKKLEAITTVRRNFQEIVGQTANPAGELLNSIVAQDDTGQALLTAISANHQSTANNAQRISAVETNQGAIEDLTGPDGAVTANTRAIADHETRISSNETMLMDHEGRITSNETMLMDHEGRITANEATLVDHGMKLMQKKEYIDNLGMHIGVDPVTGMGTGQGGMSRIDMNEANIASNRDFIEHNHEHILEHSALIESNQMSIMRNTEDIQTLKSGVAASMALAGMPEMGARGVSVGAGSYGGETALAVGVHFSGENARFKIGVTSSGGETGASLGAGWAF